MPFGLFTNKLLKVMSQPVEPFTTKMKAWLNTEPKFFHDLIVHLDMDEHPLDEEPTPPAEEPDCEHMGENCHHYIDDCEHSQKYYLMFGEEMCRECGQWTGRII